MCRLSARGSVRHRLDAAQHELERAIISTLNGVEKAQEGSERATRFHRTIWWALWVAYPILLTVMAAAVFRITFLKTFIIGSTNAALTSSVVLVVVPLIGGASALRLLSLRKQQCDRKAKELATAKADLVGRIKTELPMKQALELLLRYDPEGDHKSLIDLPPEYVEEVNALKRDNEELTRLVDALLATLLAPVEEDGAADRTGAASSAPMSSRKARMQRARTLLDIAKENGIVIPRSSSSDEHGPGDAGLDGNVSAAMATPGKGLAGDQQRRRPQAMAGAATPGPSSSPLLMKTPARTPGTSFKPATAARTGGGKQHRGSSGDLSSSLNNSLTGSVATAGAGNEDDDDDEWTGSVTSSDNPVMSTLRAVLPPGSIHVIRRHQERLTAATPMLARTGRKQGLADGGPQASGGIDNWIIRHVVASPAVSTGNGEGEGDGNSSATGESDSVAARAPEPRRLRFAAPPGDARGDEDEVEEEEKDTAPGERVEEEVEPNSGAAGLRHRGSRAAAVAE